MPRPYCFPKQLWTRLSETQVERLDRALEKDEVADSRATWIRMAIVEKLERDGPNHVVSP